MSHRAHGTLFQKQKFVVQKHAETYAVLFRLIWIGFRMVVLFSITSPQLICVLLTKFLSFDCTEL